MRLLKLCLAGVVGVTAVSRTTYAQLPPTTSPSRLVAEGGSWVAIHGDTGADVVRLIWELRAWPEQVEGFQICRRAVSEQGQPPAAWERLHPHPIVPQVSLQQDYANVDADPQEQARLRQVLAELVKKGQIRLLSAEQFKSAVRKATDKELRALRREAVNDFDHARIMGLGFADRQVAEGDRFEYGLFAVSEGIIAQSPLATYASVAFTPDDARLQATGATATRRDKGVTVQWSLEEEKVQKWSLFGFQIYRADAGTEVFQKVSRDKIGGPSVKDGMRQWLFVDNSADPDKSYIYALAPVNVFDREMLVRSRVTYVPRLNVPADLGVSAPVIKAAQQLPTENGVTIAWEMEDVPAGVIGFIVERADLPSREMKAISKLLAADTRSFIDREGQKVHRGHYAYRVTAIGADGPLANSIPKAILYFDFPAPPAPTEVSATFTQVKDKRYLRIQWTGKLDQVTRGFQIYADSIREGELLRQASIPLVLKNEYLYEISALHDRKFTIGVAAVGEGGKESTPVTASAFAVGELPAKVSNLTVKQDSPDAPIRLSWDYPDAPLLAGFRVMEGGEVLATERSLGPKARQWTLTKPVKGRAYAFTVLAVRSTGVTSAGATVQSGGGAIAGVMATDVPLAPEGLRADWVEHEGRKAIRLRWLESDGSAVGYRLGVDASVLGQVQSPQIIELTSPGEFIYVPKAVEPRTYTFVLEGLNRAGRRGPAAQVICLAPGRTIAPPQLERVTQVPGSNGRTLLIKWKHGGGNLKGFRIFIENELLVNEQVLDSNTREFTTPALDGKGIKAITIEAVDNDGSVSERSAAQRYLLN
jgi:hypothetical protein